MNHTKIISAEEQAQLEAQSGAVVLDGVLIDPETGEVLGIAEQASSISSEAELISLMERLQEMELDIERIKLQRDSINKNLGRQQRHLEKRRDAILAANTRDMAAIARRFLVRGTKYWLCAYGRISFRKTPAKLEVTNLTAAMEALPECVKHEPKFLISTLDRMRRAALMANPAEAAECGLQVVPEGEAVAVKTVEPPSGR